jgi:3-methyl-2-oxobutanoate hydroxymethyltransferase
VSSGPSPQQTARFTIASIARLYAAGERIAMLTAYDYPTARSLDAAGIPILLVGDSLGQVILGYDSTVRVTMAEMLHHAKAVVRGAKRALVVADMPFLSYGVTPEASLENAGVMMQEGGAGAVKLEGGERSARTIETIVRAGIPVMGHIGLTPQSIHQLGGHRVQGKTRAAGRQLLADALAVQQAGAFAVVLELVPEQLSAAITERLHIPTIGIGAGAGCSGQVQVVTDLLGMSDEFTPKHARHYAELFTIIKTAAESFQADVAAGTFPGPAESIRMDDGTLDEILGQTALDRPEMVEASHGIPLDRDL